MRPLHDLLFTSGVLLIASFVSSCAAQITSDPLPIQQSLLVLGQNNELFVVDPRRGSVVQMIPLPVSSGCVIWNLYPAPRGRWLALELDCDNHPWVETFNVDSGESHLIMPMRDSDSHFLGWSNAGDAVYIKAATLQSPRVARVNVDGRTDFFLARLPFVYDLAVSPDDQQIAYSLTYGLGRGSETYIADANGKHERLIIRDETHVNTFLRWSPRGDAVAFIRMEDSQTPFSVGELVVSDLSGANIQVIGEADAGHGFAPMWSPDGTQIAFVKRENESDSRADSEASALISNLIIVDVSTGSTWPISSFTDSQTSQSAWSNDGKFIAYTVTDGSKISLWVNDKQLLDDVICCAVWIAER